MRTGELYGRRKLTKVYKHYAQFSHTRFSSLAWRGGKQLSKCLARRRAIVSRVEQIVLSRAALALYLKWCFIFNFVWKLTFFTFTRCLYKDWTPHACVIYFLWECFKYLTGPGRSRQFFRGGGVGVGGWMVPLSSFQFSWRYMGGGGTVRVRSPHPHPLRSSITIYSGVSHRSGFSFESRSNFYFIDWVSRILWLFVSYSSCSMMSLV